MPAVFFMDDDALSRMQEVKLRLEKVLDRVIDDEEDIFDTFLELLNQLDPQEPQEPSTETIQWTEMGEGHIEGDLN